MKYLYCAALLILLIMLSCKQEDQVLYIIRDDVGTKLISDSKKIVFKKHGYFNSICNNILGSVSESSNDNITLINYFNNNELKINKGFVVRFHHKLDIFALMNENKYSFYNSKFELIFSKQLQFVIELDDSYFLIKCKNNKYGIIDSKGKEVLRCIYDSIYSFSKGFNSQYLQLKYDRKITSNVATVRDFDYNPGLVFIVKNKKSGICTQNGEIVVATDFDDFLNYQTNRIIAIKNGKYSLLTATGNILNKTEYEKIGFDLPKINQIDNFKLEIIPSRFTDTYREIQELTKNCDKYIPFKHFGKWGYLDSNGSEAVLAKYDSVIPPNDNIFGVKVGKNWKIIDINGNTVSRERFITIKKLFNETALCLNKMGYFIYNMKTCKKGSFYNGFVLSFKNHSVLLNNNLYYLVDNNGNEIYSKLDSIIILNEDFFTLKKGNKWYLGDANGNILEETESDVNLRLMNFYSKKSFFIKMKNNNMVLLDTFGKNIVLDSLIYLSFLNMEESRYFIAKDRSGLLGIYDSKEKRLVVDIVYNIINGGFRISERMFEPTICENDKRKIYLSKNMEVIYETKK